MTAADTFALVASTTLVHTTGAETVAGAKTFTSLTTVSLNASSLPTPTTGTAFHLSNADGVNTVFQFDAFAAVNLFDARVANGSAASPAAVASGNNMFQVSARGYGATAYAGGARWAVRCVAAQNWTDAAHGTYGILLSTPLGTTTLTEMLRWGDYTSTRNIGYLDGGPGAVKTGDYTYALTDRGTPIDHNDGSAHAFLVEPETTVAWPANSILYGCNRGAGALTIDRGAGVVIRDSSGTDADLTVPQYACYMLRKVDTNTWFGRVY
jgi:hypothetical protein